MTILERRALNNYNSEQGKSKKCQFWKAKRWNLTILKKNNLNDVLERTTLKHDNSEQDEVLGKKTLKHDKSKEEQSTR